jgi:hypothetical protein
MIELKLHVRDKDGNPTGKTRTWSDDHGYVIWEAWENHNRGQRTKTSKKASTK